MKLEQTADGIVHLTENTTAHVCQNCRKVHIMFGKALISFDEEGCKQMMELLLMTGRELGFEYDTAKLH